MMLASTVAMRFAQTVFSRDTAIDRTPADSYGRARPWMTRDLFTALTCAKGVAEDWERWSEHSAMTFVRVRPTAQADVRRGLWRRTRTVAVVVRAVGRDGWEDFARRYTVRCDLVRGVVGSWLVANFEIS